MSKCADKTPFYTDKEAEKKCKWLWRNQYVRMYWYKCELCGNYHLTKTKPGTYQIREYLRKTMPKET